MAPGSPDAEAAATAGGPVLFAYDGSELAGFAIEQAGGQLVPGREAVVVCVWQPADVGFLPISDREFDAAQASEVRKAAEETAAYGASLAERGRVPLTEHRGRGGADLEGDSSTAAEDQQASLIVLGSHRRAGLVGHLLGSVASAVVARSELSVLVVHRRA